MIVSLAVGVGVTVIASIGPARRAVRIPPVAALSDRQLSRRLAPVPVRVGTAVAAVGAVMLAVGLTEPAIALVGLGAVCIFVGAAMLAPAVARPLSGLIGRPLARAWEGGQAGPAELDAQPPAYGSNRLGPHGGHRPGLGHRRVRGSVSKSATASVKEAISADLLISASSGGLADSVPARASAVPGVTTSATIYRDQFEFKGSLETLTSAPPDHLSDTVILRMESGTEAALARGEILIDSTTARSDHLSVGDLAPVKFAAPARPRSVSAASTRRTP